MKYKLANNNPSVQNTILSLAMQRLTKLDLPFISNLLDFHFFFFFFFLASVIALSQMDLVLVQRYNESYYHNHKSARHWLG